MKKSLVILIMNKIINFKKKKLLILTFILKQENQFIIFLIQTQAIMNRKKLKESLIKIKMNMKLKFSILIIKNTKLKM